MAEAVDGTEVQRRRRGRGWCSGAEGDRISELPVHIIHHILCRTSLDPIYAALTCVLSKRWYYCWISRPNLLLNHINMPWNEFVKLVDQSLQPYVELNFRLEELSLTYRGSASSLASHMDRWIDLAVKLNVKVLKINTFQQSPLSYSLPDVFYAAKELTTLELKKCKFDFDISTTSIRFCCLKDLYLRCVHISEEQFQRVTNRCPFIRNLKLSNCEGLNKLHLFGLVHLERLEVAWCRPESMMMIVQAPNLRCFQYSERYSRSQTDDDYFLPCKIEIVDAYNNLEILKLHGSNITEQQFQDLFSKFSNISVLELRHCYELKNIEIVSENLKRLLLSHWKNLEQVKIKAPNLVEFNFHCDKDIPFSFIGPSTLERGKLRFSFPVTVPSNFGEVDTNWYANLHHFVQKFNYSKGLILVTICRQLRTILIYEEPREVVVPPSHEVEIVITPMWRVESFIDRKIMRWHPKIISILPSTNSKLLQVLPTYMGSPDKQNYGEGCAFHAGSFDCWHCDLKEVSNAIDTAVEEKATIWRTWLESTPLLHQVTNFMMKWKFGLA